MTTFIKYGNCKNCPPLHSDKRSLIYFMISGKDFEKFCGKKLLFLLYVIGKNYTNVLYFCIVCSTLPVK